MIYWIIWGVVAFTYELVVLWHYAKISDKFGSDVYLVIRTGVALIWPIVLSILIILLPFWSIIKLFKLIQTGRIQYYFEERREKKERLNEAKQQKYLLERDMPSKHFYR